MPRPQTKRPKRRAAARTVLTLSDDWRVWVVENLLAGVPRATLLETLTDNGVSARLARREVSAIVASPALVACQRLRRRVKRLEMVAALRRATAALASDPRGIERRSGVSGPEFFDRYYAANEPVVLTDLMTSWKARARWSPRYFKERFGHVTVEITSGREADPDYDMNFAAHSEAVTLAEYVDRLLAAGETNDLYLVANNRNMEKKALAALFDDVGFPPEYFDRARRFGAVSLWIGPAGTVTPLHHDTSNILFCQVFGRKRIKLVSPLETDLLDGMRGVYSVLDAERDLGRRKRLRHVAVREVDLAAGEALFIPVGWWHHVRALEVSINFSLLNFRRPNQFGWFNPGALG
jgi:hypothetical protein